MTTRHSRTPDSGIERDMLDTSKKVLDACIEQITGRTDIPPREGQVELLADVARAMALTEEAQGCEAGAVVGAAPTGTGKSLAYLVPAAVAAAKHGTRTLVSTEMISLQTQVIDKDAPVVAAACEDVTGYRPTFAVYKGWSNYACTQRAIIAACDSLGVDTESINRESGLANLAERLSNHLEGAKKEVAKKSPRTRSSEFTFTGKATTDPRTANLGRGAQWALNHALGAGTGDRGTYPDVLTGEEWAQLSVASSECLGMAKCPVADWCLPGAARQRAADADVVVSNHHLLAVQAARAVPVVIGNKTLGDFTHLVVDEAHGLPGIVRDKGATEVSARAVNQVLRSVKRILGDDGSDARVSKVVADGERLAQYVTDTLSTQVKPRDEVTKVGAADNPINDIEPVLTTWIAMVKSCLQAVESTANSHPDLRMKWMSASGRLEEFSDAVRQVGRHEVGRARWVERGEIKGVTTYAACSSPVDVSSDIAFNLTRVAAPLDPETEAEQPNWSDPNTAPEDDVRPMRHLSAIMLSATLPNGFPAQVGVRAPIKAYKSPFDDAYGASALFVPRAVTPDDVAALTGRYGNKFDTGKHPEWALSHMIDLIEANGGSALVLAATVGAGRTYAEGLARAARGRWRVLSQWDGPPLRSQVAAWKSDKSAVLIGTKSLMTGVDASGDTCTLVIVDRPARSRSNPVDDARVEAITDALGIDKWAADRLVYVADAAMLLAQAAGRLIRSVDDSGMVAVLDPRLLKTGSFTYPGPTREAYMGALDKFPVKMADAPAALDWLAARRGRVVAMASA